MVRTGNAAAKCLLQAPSLHAGTFHEARRFCAAVHRSIFHHHRRACSYRSTMIANKPVSVRHPSLIRQFRIKSEMRLTKKSSGSRITCAGQSLL